MTNMICSGPFWALSIQLVSYTHIQLIIWKSQSTSQAPLAEWSRTNWGYSFKQGVIPLGMERHQRYHAQLLWKFEHFAGSIFIWMWWCFIIRIISHSHYSPQPLVLPSNICTICTDKITKDIYINGKSKLISLKCESWE